MPTPATPATPANAEAAAAAADAVATAEPSPKSISETRTEAMADFVDALTHFVSDPVAFPQASGRANALRRAGDRLSKLMRDSLAD